MFSEEAVDKEAYSSGRPRRPWLEGRILSLLFERKVHLSLYFVIPVLLVLLACAPLLIAVLILSRSLFPLLWSQGVSIPPDRIQGLIWQIAIEFGLVGLLALAVGFVLAYGITRPITRFRKAFQEIISGRPSELDRLEATGEFVRMAEAFNRMVSVLQLQEQLQRTEKLAALGTLAAGVAHEVRNPLGSIRGLAQMLKEGVPEDKRQKYAETIMNQTDRLDRVLESLLHLARPSTPMLKKENLNDLLHQAGELVGIEARLKQIRLIEQLDPGLPELEMDGEAMTQAFFNILINAVQAIPRKGEVLIRTSQPVPGRVRVEIRNDRSTIPAEDLNRIFDPFFTTKKNGTGLGLSITHQIVTAHGGTIDVKSGRNETTFTIELPVK